MMNCYIDTYFVGHLFAWWVGHTLQTNLAAKNPRPQPGYGTERNRRLLWPAVAQAKPRRQSPCRLFQTGCGSQIAIGWPGLSDLRKLWDSEYQKVLHPNELADLPGWLLMALFGLSLRGPGRGEAIELLHTLAPEIRLVLALLLAGSRSPACLRGVLPILARSMPHAAAVEPSSLNHSASEKAAAPTIAARVRQFVVDHQPQDEKMSN